MDPVRPAAQPGDRLLQALFFAYPDSLLVVDGEGRIVRANPSAATLLGYSGSELEGLQVEALVPPAARARHAGFRRGYAQDPKPRPMGMQTELVARRKDGSEVLVEIALSPLQGEGPPLVVAAIRDVAAYPRVQQALRRARYSEQLARLGRLAVDTREPQRLLEQAPAGAAEALQAETALLYLLDPEGLVFTLASGTGLMPGQALGECVANHPDTLPGWLLGSGAQVLPGEPANAGLERPPALPPALREAGLQSLLALPLSDRGRATGVLLAASRQPHAFGDDERRFLEALCNLLATCLQRAQSEIALAHAQRLESVGQLTGGIAHDFNNLLTVIQGNLQVLEELPALSTDAHGRQLLSAALRAARRGAELTGKLLAFSRRQVLQPDALAPAQVLQPLADMLRRTLDQRIRIEVDVAPGCPPLLADPGQLESALLNIAINARDAMREGGTLGFSAHACERLPAGLGDAPDAADASPQGYVAIAISDTGTGMDEAVKRRAFEPFFTTKELGRGTGLGLSTVYGFVRQSRGALALDSAPGAGTTLTMFLPQPVRAAVDALPDTDGAAPALPPGLRVLLVEDDAEVRQVAQNFLAALGCEVAAAASGEQALDLLARSPDFELLLSDIALGAGMRGTELAARAQAAQPRLAVLLMSGYPEDLLDADREAPLDWELLPKPFSRGELASALARLMAARA